jgi:hypothetical protein
LQALDGAIMGTERAIAESQDAIEDLRSAAIADGDLVQLVKRTGEDLMASQPSDHDSPFFGVTVEGQPRALTPIIQVNCTMSRVRYFAMHSGTQHVTADRSGQCKMVILLASDFRGPKIVADKCSGGCSILEV